MRLNLQRIPFIKNNHIPWIIWSIAGLFYFYEIILRMLPGTMAGQLMSIFHINATQLGVFTAFYYWSYTLMQIPAGLIVDRFSVRRTLLTATMFCTGGFAIVHLTNTLGIAESGRFIIGLGSAFAYVSALKVASVWLPRNQFGLASCIVDSLGMIGAMFTDVVLVRLNLTSGYRTSVNTLLITGAIVAILIFFIFRDGPGRKVKNGHHFQTEQVDKTNIFDKLVIIARNPQIWLIGLVGLLFYLPSSVIGDVWGIPYLRHVYRLDKEHASWLLATFFAGWTIVGPFLGAISDKIRRRCLPLVITILMDALLFSIIIFTPHFTSHLLPIDVLFVMFFFIGVATGTHPLVFALAIENYPVRIAGSVVAFTNTLIMLGGLLFQPLVGFLLDYNHHSLTNVHSIQHYTSANYTFALSIIPLSLMICLFIMFFIKETGNKIDESEEIDKEYPMVFRA